MFCQSVSFSIPPPSQPLKGFGQTDTRTDTRTNFPRILEIIVPFGAAVLPSWELLYCLWATCCALFVVCREICLHWAVLLKVKDKL